MTSCSSSVRLIHSLISTSNCLGPAESNRHAIPNSWTARPPILLRKSHEEKKLMDKKEDTYRMMSPFPWIIIIRAPTSGLIPMNRSSGTHSILCWHYLLVQERTVHGSPETFLFHRVKMIPMVRRRLWRALEINACDTDQREVQNLLLVKEWSSITVQQKIPCGRRVHL
jgi:hypothetical protein